MSLTYLIKNSPPVRKLFEERIGNIQYLFKTENGKEAFPKYTPIITPVPNDPNWNKIESAANVGTAYDFYFRAFLQRKNELLKEEELSPVVKKGVKILQNKMNFAKGNALEEDIEKIWMLRNRYIKGETVKGEVFFWGMLVLAYVESHYRSSRTNLKNDYRKVNLPEYENLVALAKNTKTKHSQPFFTIHENADFNPDFGEYSKKVGNADADLIIDNTLIDIKTKSAIKYEWITDDVFQIIGYYVLDKFNKKSSGQKPLDKVGLYFSRHDHFVYINTKELEEKMDVDKFGNDLFSISKQVFKL